MFTSKDFFREIPILHDTCATCCSELPSYLGTMEVPKEKKTQTETIQEWSDIRNKENTFVGGRHYSLKMCDQKICRNSAVLVLDFFLPSY